MEFRRVLFRSQRPHFRLARPQVIIAMKEDLVVGRVGVGRQQPHDGRDKGRLAAARLPDNAENTTAAEIERYIAQDLEPAGRRAKSERKVADLENAVVLVRRHHASFLSLGSKMSRNASPRKVKARVVRISGMPPAITGQGESGRAHV